MTSRDLKNQGLHLLSHLLPYDPTVKTGERLLDGLKEYLLLLIASEQAAESFLQGELECFDPLVGENACQIRALQLAVFLRDDSFDISRLLNNINHSKLALKELIQAPAIVSSGTSLHDVIKDKKIDIQLNDGEIYLVKSYLLSKVKTQRPFKPELPLVKNEYTDTKKIKAIGGVGTMFSENLVKSLREKLSSSSVKFVQKIAAQLPTSESSIEMVSDKFLVNHRGLECLPCYWVTKILMWEAKNKGIPIVILAEQVAKDLNYEVVRKMTIFFQPTSEGYQETPSSSLDPDTPVLAFLGRSCRNSSEFPETDQWRKELLEYNPVDLILAYAATHRQYPDLTKEHLVSGVQDEHYAYYKTKSHEWGCSAENPSLFFLSHAYCDKIKNITRHCG